MRQGMPLEQGKVAAAIAPPYSSVSSQTANTDEDILDSQPWTAMWPKNPNKKIIAIKIMDKSTYKVKRDMVYEAMVKMHEKARTNTEQVQSKGMASSLNRTAAVFVACAEQPGQHAQVKPLVPGNDATLVPEFEGEAVSNFGPNNNSKGAVSANKLKRLCNSAKTLNNSLLILAHVNSLALAHVKGLPYNMAKDLSKQLVALTSGTNQRPTLEMALRDENFPFAVATRQAKAPTGRGVIHILKVSNASSYSAHTLTRLLSLDPFAHQSQ